MISVPIVGWTRTKIYLQLFPNILGHGILPLSDSTSCRMNKRQMTLGTKLVSNVLISFFLRREKKYSATNPVQSNQKTPGSVDTLKNTRTKKKQLNTVEQGFFELCQLKLRIFLTIYGLNISSFHYY